MATPKAWSDLDRNFLVSGFGAFVFPINFLGVMVGCLFFWDQYCCFSIKYVFGQTTRAKSFKIGYCLVSQGQNDTSTHIFRKYCTLKGRGEAISPTGRRLHHGAAELSRAGSVVLGPAVAERHGGGRLDGFTTNGLRDKLKQIKLYTKQVDV